MRARCGCSYQGLDLGKTKIDPLHQQAYYWTHTFRVTWPKVFTHHTVCPFSPPSAVSLLVFFLTHRPCYSLHIIFHIPSHFIYLFIVCMRFIRTRLAEGKSHVKHTPAQAVSSTLQLTLIYSHTPQACAYIKNAWCTSSLFLLLFLPLLFFLLVFFPRPTFMSSLSLCQIIPACHISLISMILPSLPVYSHIDTADMHRGRFSPCTLTTNHTHALMTCMHACTSPGSILPVATEAAPLPNESSLETTHWLITAYRYALRHTELALTDRTVEFMKDTRNWD